jgi:tetratricopeptide (TPR) repeat protein
MPSDHAARGNTRKLAQLWQLPLLLSSLGLFGYAAYLFIDPKPGLTVDQKIDAARVFLRDGRPAASIAVLNQVLNTEKLLREKEAKIHLLLAESIESAQKQQKLDLEVNHERIIEQTNIALSQGVKPQADIYRRLGESYESIGKSPQALENYRRASAMDPGKALSLQRKVIDLQLTLADAGPAEASLEAYLKDERLADAERAWALGKRAQILVDRGGFIEARALLGEALRSDDDPTSQGQYHYSLGYCAYKLGETAEAERLLRVARDQLKIKHPLDADAACLLGKLRQEAGDAKEAVSFFQDVIVGHPDSAVAPLARLGRGVARVMLKEDEPGLSDLHDLVGEITAKSSRSRYRAEAVQGIRKAAAELTSRENLEGALELLAYEQQLTQKVDADFFLRLADIYEKRADQLEKAIDATSADAADRIRKTEKVREFRTKGGDAWIAYSRGVTVANDKAHGDALWRGVDLYDRAGNMQNAIAALELFVAERPDDGVTPNALLRLGRAYQAAGLYDKAIGAFQKNLNRYPQSLAASKSGVPLAQALIAKGPQFHAQAEKALLRVINDNPLITPAAEEFRQALFELSQLYYRTDRYEESIARLEEMTERYPDDDRAGQLVFLMADGYRKSAAMLNSPKATASVSADPKAVAAQAAAEAEAATARMDRLGRARKLYDRAIEQYKAKPPTRELDQLYQKLSHFYRADCVYDLGGYEEAIRLYDSAAMKYQDDPGALAAYVQIVNSYCALGRVAEAKTANERAKWLLKKIPSESFENGQFAMPKAYWEQWLKWTNDAGLWK